MRQRKEIQEVLPAVGPDLGKATIRVSPGETEEGPPGACPVVTGFYHRWRPCPAQSATGFNPRVRYPIVGNIQGCGQLCHHVATDTSPTRFWAELGGKVQGP